jgi:hypothetical protein
MDDSNKLILEDDSQEAESNSLLMPVEKTPGGRARWRTTLTVSILAGIVTISYVLGGALRVATKFLRNLTKTSSVSGSFEAAVDEFENRMGRISKIKSDGKEQQEKNDEPEISSNLTP